MTSGSSCVPLLVGPSPADSYSWTRTGRWIWWPSPLIRPGLGIRLCCPRLGDRQRKGGRVQGQLHSQRYVRPSLERNLLTCMSVAPLSQLLLLFPIPGMIALAPEATPWPMRTSPTLLSPQVRHRIRRSPCPGQPLQHRRFIARRMLRLSSCPRITRWSSDSLWVVFGARPIVWRVASGSPSVIHPVRLLASSFRGSASL